MRRLLRDVAEGRELGDTSTLVDPTVFEAIRAGAARRDQSGSARGSFTT
jgi:acetyl-CoA synthetase